MNDIKEIFIPYQEAFEMKLLGFDEDCFSYYNENFTLSRIGLFYCYDNPSDFICLAPTYSQCFSWFREKYNLNCEISYAGKKEEYHAFVNNYIYGNNGNNPSIFSYEQAELECLRQLIKIVKNENT